MALEVDYIKNMLREEERSLAQQRDQALATYQQALGALQAIKGFRAWLDQPHGLPVAEEMSERDFTVALERAGAPTPNAIALNGGGA